VAQGPDRRAHAQLQRARRRPPRTQETEELGKGSSQPGCLDRGELRRGIERGWGDVGAGVASGDAYPPWVVDGRAAADVLMSSGTLSDPAF
jgi:hypothetical protein